MLVAPYTPRSWFNVCSYSIYCNEGHAAGYCIFMWFWIPTLMIDHAMSFVAVVNAAGFTQAAKRSGISKAKLSRDVKELEGKLGIQLLHRTTRAFSMTEQGKEFYESCRGIEEIYSNSIESLKRNFSSMSGTLKITAPTDFGVKFLVPIIREFCEQYSSMNVSLSLTNINENLTEGQYDLAIRIANKLPDSSLRMLTLMQFQRIVCATPAYIKKNQAPKKPQDLKNHLCTSNINRSMNTVRPSWAFYDGKKIVNYSLEKFIEADSYDLQKQLAESSVCIARLPSYYITEELKAGILVELLQTVKKPVIYAYVLYPDTLQLPHKTRVFIELIKKYLDKIK